MIWVRTLLLLFLFRAVNAAADLSLCLPPPLNEMTHYPTQPMVAGALESDYERDIHHIKSFWNRSRLEIRFENGKPFSFTGDDLQPFPSIRRIYVMNRRGSHFSMPEGYNHSTPLAGEEVSAAGKIAFEEGSFRYIDNGSGHYRIGRESLLYSLASLVRHGVDIAGAEVEFFDNLRWYQLIRPRADATRFLFNTVESQACIETLAKDAERATSAELHAYERLIGDKKYKRFIDDLIASGKIKKYQPALKKLMEEFPETKRFFSEKVLKTHFEDIKPDKKGFWTCFSRTFGI